MSKFFFVSARLAIVFCLFPHISFSQNKYWVFFKDKQEASFNPYTYFDAKALARRVQHGLPLCDSTDFPVSEVYINEVSKLVDSVSYSSRWFNALAIYASKEAVDNVKKMTFVKYVKLMELPLEHMQCHMGELKDTVIHLTLTELNILKNQTRSMQSEVFTSDSISGKGIRIAVLDAGFAATDKYKALKSIIDDKRIIKTYDFIKKKENVYRANSHGTHVLSCIAGKYDNYKLGLATEAEFLLAITENDWSETIADEERWLAGLEWADKHGAMIVSSSLGHAYGYYFPEDLNGHTSLVSKAANMAARKGILVINAAGNEGNSKWKHLLTPGDADSVLTVGGIEYNSGFHINFSSYGPTADKRLKPNVCAFGEAVVAGDKGLEYERGTSFAAPLVAGFAACAWQKNRSLKNMELFHAIEKSASLYPYYDYAHGYGVPQASFFYNQTKTATDTTFDFVSDSSSVQLILRDGYFKKENCNVQQLVYLHIENSAGYLDDYYVVTADSKKIISFNLKQYRHKQKLRAHFKGFTNAFQF